ncbi:DUF3870 domain-containing protein [Paramaledivibacter caminithermalis]|uniref:DUF3870 domain-containing protein n=1 Tax=Paramaledivibacter caminithermalis (strain DSM 15212 / CIP 107654 / DViRD3) TaxID=1121301 RepID=A0A1M6TKB6_PARC5|nr:DUF3870 domain-containing protein [Paramaledivibacter caminithermalis]SHK57370.1 protein of unknown function [Paramaledivibacter caminithermalis DSM 15212]
MDRIYNDETVYFISYAKLPGTISAAKLLDVVGIGLVINSKTGIIEDTSCTLITDEAKRFLKEIIVGHNVHEEGLDELINKIQYRFHGLSQKAICVAVKAAIERYETWKKEMEDR